VVVDDERLMLGLREETVISVELVKVVPESSDAAIYQVPVAIRLGLNDT
jgi:hypothetical protein